MMTNQILDQLSNQLFSTVAKVMVICAIGVIVIGLPLLWLRIKLERKLIQVGRSWRARREARKQGTLNVSQLGQIPHSPICNALMVTRTARRGANSGSQFWGCSNYPKCHGTRAV